MTERTVALDAGYIESHGADTACPERSLWVAVIAQAGLDLSSSDEQIRRAAVNFLLGDDLLVIMNLAGISRAHAPWLRERAKAICQQSGRLRRHRVTFRGEARTVKEWSRITGLAVGTIVGRIRYGWPVERALTVPIQKASGHSRRT